jgi:hypothetical protein
VADNIGLDELNVTKPSLTARNAAASDANVAVTCPPQDRNLKWQFQSLELTPTSQILRPLLCRIFYVSPWRLFH